MKIDKILYIILLFLFASNIADHLHLQYRTSWFCNFRRTS